MQYDYISHDSPKWDDKFTKMEYPVTVQYVWISRHKDGTEAGRGVRKIRVRNMQAAQDLVDHWNRNAGLFQNLTWQYILLTGTMKLSERD